jgi:hypothetical protein
MRKLLMALYWLGIAIDAAATLLLFSPTVADMVLQPKPFEISPVYLYVTRVAGALMLGWTVLLVWAQLKPIERADVLLITLFPVVSVLAVAAILVAQSGHIAGSRLVPLFGLYALLGAAILPSWLWARRQPRD